MSRRSTATSSKQSFRPALVDALGGLRPVALVHTAGAFAMLSFLVVHLYMITTGKTLGSNLRSMLTGWVEH